MKKFTTFKLRSTVTALGMLGLSLCSINSMAQTNIANYTYAISNSAYTPITGGTVFSTSYDNDVSAAITMGGTFPFGGANMTTCYISGNGYITFGAAPSGTNYTPLSTLGSTTGAIAAYGQDGASSTVTGALPEIRYFNTGTEFVVQFQDHANYYARSVERLNFQIRLEYGTGAVKIIYGNCTLASTTTDGITAHTGIRGNSTTYTSNVNNLMIGNVPSGTTCNWSNAVTGNANSSTMLYANSTNPSVNIPNGLTYTWNPGTQAPVRTFAATTGVTTNGATINWTAPTGATQYNVRYRASNACNWTMASGNPYTSNTAAITGLASSTTYMVQVQALNGSTQSIWSHIPNAGGGGNGYATAGSFTTLASCLTPAGLANNTVTNNGATVKWTPTTPAPATGYQYYVSTTNTAPTASTTPTGSVTDTFKVLTGLPPATLHYVWVRSACVGSDVSAWTSSTSFTTLCVTPTPGATLSSGGTNMCANQSTTLSLTSSVTGTGIAYLWQSSTNGSSYTNISGATATTYTANFTGPIYYRARVICSAGPDTVYSTPVQLNYTNSVASTTPGQRCGAGTVALAAAGSSGTTVRWYANANGGLQLGAGNAFTTPYIAATTNFYAEATTNAPGNVKVGTGTTSESATSYPNPLSAYYGGTKSQLLFLASELQAQGLLAGNLTSIAFDVTDYAAAGVLNDLRLKIDTTSSTALSGMVPVANTVYNAAYTPATTGVVTFTFSSPYNWDGVSNIVLEVTHNAGNGGNGSGTRVAYTTTSFNSVYTRAIDNITPATSASFDAALAGGSTAGSTSTSANRPNITFGGMAYCRSARVPVAATVNTAPSFTASDDKTVCNNGVTTLTVTGTQANYNNVTWSPVTNLFTNAAATTPYVANTHAYTVYHKSGTAGTENIIATANNTTTSCGAVDTVKLQVLPATTTAIADPGVLCFSGTSNLTLNPAIAQTGVQYQWQTSTNNTTFSNIAGATNVAYTTPVLTNTTYFRAVVNNSDGQLCFNSVSDTVLVQAPAITSVVGGERCGPGAIALSAAATVGTTTKWYSAATGGPELATGSNFTTPSINTSTTYYVEASLGSPQYNVGLLNNAVALSYFITTGWGMTFNATEPTVIQSVAVYPQNAGTMTISVQSSMSNPTVFGTYTATFTAAQAGTKVVLPINVTIPAAGNGYKMIVQSYTGLTGLHRESVSTGFPYTTAGSPVSVTSSEWGGTTTGTYYFFYDWVIGKTPCASARTPVTATIKTTPTAGLSPSGTVSICDGQTQTLTATGGPSYTWLKNNVAVSGQTAGTFSATQADNYKVVVTASNGCTDTSAVTNLTVNANPVVNIGTDTAICQGASLSLDAGNSGASFAWSNGVNTATNTVSAAGTYSVTVTNSNNCSTADTIVVTENALPVVNLGNDTAICEGASLMLDAATGTATDTYIWDDQSTGNSRTVTTGASYHVTVTNVAGCSASDTIQVGINPLPSADNITVSGTSPEFSFGVSNGQNINSYSWNFGDNSPLGSGANADHTYTPTSVTQTFVVTVIISNDCGSDTLSMNVTVSPVGIKNPQLNANQLKLYPNPATQSVVLENVSGLNMKHITLFNVLGQEVLSLPVTNNTKQSINVTPLTSGMYHVRIECEEGTVTRKLEIIK